MGPAVQLRELFPQHSHSQLQAALAECNGQLDAAAEKLLQQTPAGSGLSAASPTVKAQPKTGKNRQSSGTNNPRPSHANTSWAALRDMPPATPGTRNALPGPVFMSPRTKASSIAPALTQQQFPALSVSSQQQHVQAHQQQLHSTVGQKQQRVRTEAAEPAGEDVSSDAECASNCHDGLQTACDARSPLQQQHGAQPLARRRSLSAQSFAEMARAAAPLRLEHTSRCPSPLLAGCQCSPWPQQSSPLRAAGQQINLPLHQRNPEQRGVIQLLHGRSKDAAGATSTSATVEASSNRQQQMAMLQHHPQQGFQSAASLQQQSRMQNFHHDPHQQQQGQMPGVVLDHDRDNTHQLALAPMHQKLTSTHQQQQQDNEDVYHVMRREAIRLSHRWQKVSKRSAAAAAAGDHSMAKQLGAEARALKLAADEAHAAAAVKIEVANNTHSSAGLWELDLHGLHVQEALTALHERLQLLQDILQHAPPAAAQQSTAVASSSSRQHLLTQLLLADDAQSVPLHVRQAAARRELRVIVGRGNNSSGGEASLPRVVEQWLGEQKYKFILRSGAIDVRLKRGS